MIQVAPHGSSATARDRLRAVAHRVGVASGIRSEALSRFVALTDLVAGEAVTGVDAARTSTYSAINGTGVPVQFSLAIGAGPAAARVLGEAGWPGLTMKERLLRGGRQLLAVLESLGQLRHVPAIDHLLAVLLPPTVAHLDGWTGAVWCGVVVLDTGEVGTRLYINQRWGALTDRIVRLRSAVLQVAGESAAEQWEMASRFVSVDLNPYGVALDIGSTGVARIKVYAASREPRTAAIVPYLTAAAAHCHLATCDDLIAACQALGGWSRPRMVMPCLEFTRSAPVRAKIDVALCTLPSSDVHVNEMLRRTLHVLALPLHRYDEFLQALSPLPLALRRVERLQYASIGVHQDRHELTVYASPDLESRSAGGMRRDSACSTCAVV